MAMMRDSRLSGMNKLVWLILLFLAVQREQPPVWWASISKHRLIPFIVFGRVSCMNWLVRQRVPLMVRMKLMGLVGRRYLALLRRGAYTRIIPDASSGTLPPLIEHKVLPDNLIYSDCWRGDKVLDVSAFKHHRITPSKGFADRHHHINGIETFWCPVRCHLRQFKGVPKGVSGYF